MVRSLPATLGAAQLACMAPAAATGLYECDSGDRSGWRSPEELEQQMIADGWTVRRIKEDGGCEAYGTTPEGERVEAYFDPVTFGKLLVARRGEILLRKAE
jgi:hypothetical protein